MSRPGGLSRALSAVLGATLALAAAGLPTRAAAAQAGAAGTAGAVISGKVTRDGGGIGGARVFAYDRFDALLALRPAAVSAPSREDGGFRLALPAGTYYLAAKRLDGEGDGPLPAGGLLSFPGSNPFTLPPGADLEVNFPLVRKVGEPVVGTSEDPAAGTLGGVVTWQGKPLAGVTVKLYLDAESDFRGMGYASAPPTDESGTFRFEYLPESAYFVVARRRAAGQAPGPIAEGDFYGWYPGNPVAVRAGAAVAIAMELVTKSREAGNADTRPRPTGTSVAGRILDAVGSPVAGVHAYAYEEKVMSHKKPAFLSAESGADGRYTIYLSRGGTFYIGARSGYGDSPAKGEWLGFYDGTADHSVSLAAGENRDGIDVIVERVLP